MEEVVLVLHLLLAVGLVAAVLLQRSEGGGLGMGSGGSGGGFGGGAGGGEHTCEEQRTHQSKQASSACAAGSIAAHSSAQPNRPR